MTNANREKLYRQAVAREAQPPKACGDCRYYRPYDRCKATLRYPNFDRADRNGLCGHKGNMWAPKLGLWGKIKEALFGPVLCNHKEG